MQLEDLLAKGLQRMGHPIELELPDEVYAKVSALADAQKRDPETIILSWVREAAERVNEAPIDLGSPSGQDPLFLLAGIINVPDPDSGDHHDEYFGADVAE